MPFKVQGTTVIDDNLNLTVNQLTVSGPISTVGALAYNAVTTPTYTGSTNTHTIDCSQGNYFSIVTEAIPPQIVNWSFIDHTATTSTVYNLPAGIEPNDKIYIYITSTTGGYPAVTGYTQGGSNFAGNSGIVLYLANAISPVPTTFTVAARTGTGNSILVVIYRNIQTTTNRISDFNLSTGLPNAPAATVTAGGFSLVIGYMKDTYPTGIAAPTGYTLMGSYAGTVGTLMVAYKNITVSGSIDPDPFTGSGSGGWYAINMPINPTSSYNPNLVITNIPTTNRTYAFLLKITNNTADGLVYPANTLFSLNNAFIPAKGSSHDQLLITHNGGANWLVSNITGV